MTKPAVVSLLFSQVTADLTADLAADLRYNENCSDLDLGDICNEQCVQALVDCVIGCE